MLNKKFSIRVVYQTFTIGYRSYPLLKLVYDSQIMSFNKRKKTQLGTEEKINKEKKV